MWGGIPKFTFSTILRTWHNLVNTLRPRQNGRHFADDNLKCIFLNENAWILIEISLKFVHKGSINNIPALVRIMAWRRPGDKPFSEPMLVRIPTHICVTRPQRVNDNRTRPRLCPSKYFLPDSGCIRAKDGFVYGCLNLAKMKWTVC